MAEIKCPMCSKPNPEDLEVCQFCEARLKPVTDELARSQPPIHPGDEPIDVPTGELEPVLPQWLQASSPSNRSNRKVMLPLVVTALEVTGQTTETETLEGVWIPSPARLALLELLSQLAQRCLMSPMMWKC